MARPLIETDPPLAIRILEGQYAKLEKLDPSDRAFIDDAERFLHADVKKVFGPESDEYIQIWKHNIIEDGHLLPLHDDDFDMYEGTPWREAKAKAGIEKMLGRIGRPIDRAKELAAIHSSTRKGNAMGLGLVDDFGTDFVLVKQNGEVVRGRGIRDVAKGRLLVEDEQFPVEVGDTIVFTLPNGMAERYDVIDTGYQAGPPGSDLGHYNIKLRHVSARSVPSSVVHNTTYNNSGVAGAMGPGASVAGSTVIGQATQWNGIDRDQLADDLGKLKAALLAKAGEDDDAAAELGPVGEASKALKAGDEQGFMGALKRFGKKALAVGESLSLAALDHYMRVRLGLPPAGGT